MYNVYDSLVKGVMFCHVLDCTEKKKKKGKNYAQRLFHIHPVLMKFFN